MTPVDPHESHREHEWYWGNGRPSCVNCGALAHCDTSQDVVARAVAAEAEREELMRDALTWRKRYERAAEALEEIVATDPVDNALDPQRPARIAREALNDEETK
jgi:hypothetical protein